MVGWNCHPFATTPPATPSAQPLLNTELYRKIVVFRAIQSATASRRFELFKDLINGAFEDCSSLTDITFYSVPTIRMGAFIDVNKSGLTIHCPSSIREDLERILATDKGFTAEDFSSERVVFKEDPTLAPLTYLFGF